MPLEMGTTTLPHVGRQPRLLAATVAAGKANLTQAFPTLAYSPEDPIKLAPVREMPSTPSQIEHTIMDTPIVTAPPSAVSGISIAILSVALGAAVLVLVVAAVLSRRQWRSPREAELEPVQEGLMQKDEEAAVTSDAVSSEDGHGTHRRRTLTHMAHDVARLQQQAFTHARWPRLALALAAVSPAKPTSRMRHRSLSRQAAQSITPFESLTASQTSPEEIPTTAPTAAALLNDEGSMLTFHPQPVADFARCFATFTEASERTISAHVCHAQRLFRALGCTEHLGTCSSSGKPGPWAPRHSCSAQPPALACGL